MKRCLLKLSLAIASITVLLGCGGGGGGTSGPTANVRGRIMLVSTGAPLSGASVRIGGQSVTTGATGEFQFSGVQATPSPQILVTAPGIATLTQTVPALTPGQANDIGDIFVVDTGGSYTAVAKGTVVNVENFQPIANARVTISGQQVTTGQNGSFTISNLPVGLGSPDVVIGKITDATTPARFETKNIVIDLPLGASPPDNDLGAIPVSPPVGTIPGGPFNVRGTVSQQGVADMSGTLVSLIRKSDSVTVETFVTGANGAYGFWVVSGEYTVRAERGALSKTADASLVKIDQPITVNLTLGP